MVVWALPEADEERPHGIKYRLYYGRDGKRLVGYDNERGKGDHKHVGDKEMPYQFGSIEQLISDFWNDIETFEVE